MLYRNSHMNWSLFQASSGASPWRGPSQGSSFDFVTSILLEKNTDAELQRAESSVFDFSGRRGAGLQQRIARDRAGQPAVRAVELRRTPEKGHTIRWQVSYATAPSTVTIQLQTAMNDVDAQYAFPLARRIWPLSLTSGDNLIASGARANLVRAKVIFITGGSGVTVQILG